MSLRVLKLGGSLLDLPELAARLDDWLARQQAWASVMVVGGGPLADAIRAADRVHRLGEETSHHLCLQAMGVTAALAHALFAGSRLCDELGQIDRRLTGAVQILDVRQCIDGPQPAGALRLPASWRVTSDSIAAYVARALGADELVLLKSSLPGAAHDVDSLVQAGFVDDYFPAAWAGTPLRIVNVRGDGFPQRTIRAGQAAAGASAPNGSSPIR